MLPYEHWSNYALYIATGTMVICFVLSGIGAFIGMLLPPHSTKWEGDDHDSRKE